MKQNTDKTIALYYRIAHQSIEPHLDNQMKKLLCYAKESRLKSYALYADTEESGLTFDRPALSGLMDRMREGSIEEIIVTDTARISRKITSMMEFVHFAEGCGVDITVLDENITVDIFLLLSYLMEGGCLK